MKILQVKKYHREIADKKYLNQLTHNPKSMYYFMLEDTQGFPTEERKKGYVAFNKTKACWGSSRARAIVKFNG